MDRMREIRGRARQGSVDSTSEANNEQIGLLPMNEVGRSRSSSVSDPPPVPVKKQGRKLPAYFVYVLLVIMNACLSLWHVLGKAMLRRGVDPLVLAFYREVLGAMVLVSCAIWTGQLKRIKHWKRFMLLGVFNYLGLICFLVGLELSSATTAALFSPVIPVFATAVSVAVGYESMTRKKAFLVACAVIGAMIVSLKSDHAHDTAAMPQRHSYAKMLLGPIFLAIASYGTACYIVFQRQVLPHYGTFCIGALGYSLGAVLISLTVMLHARISPWPVVFGLGSKDWATLAYAAVFATALPSVAVTWASRQIEASTISSFYSVQPVTTCIFSMVLFGRFPHLQELVGGAVIIGGLLGMSAGGKSSSAKKNDDLDTSKYVKMKAKV